MFLRRIMKDTSINSNSTPGYFYDSITDITPEDIKKMGGKAVGIDLDNTTVYDSTLQLFKGVKKWLSDVHKAGLPVIIVTNTYGIRAKLIAKKMGNLPCIYDANKPEKACFEKACEMAGGVKMNEFVMIGDQLFTDIQGANNAGAVSVRVRYKAREVVFFPYFISIRKKEKLYLENKGLGDKI